MILAGHMVSYGAPVEQAIRLAGARVVPVGQATSAHAYQLAGAISERTAAAVYVVSHHTVQYGMPPLAEFAEVAHIKGVPVIVDAASEYDLRGLLAAGADLALYSSHKFLGGPTGGIVAGRRDLVRAAFLQNSGIGRGMKVGKEGIAGAIAALEAWERRDHAGVRARETEALHLWRDTLEGRPGVTATIVPDPTANPLERLHVAWSLRRTHHGLGSGGPAGLRKLPGDRARPRDRARLLPDGPLQPASRRGNHRRREAREELDGALASNEIIATSVSARRARRLAPGSPGRTDPWW